MPVNIIWIKTHVKQILIDQFIQNWRSEIGNSSRGHFYSLFKQEFCIEPYLLRIDIVPSAVIFLTELSCWPKDYSSKTTLLIGWSHRYKFYGRHYNQDDRYEISIYQITMDLLLFT